MKRKIYRYLVIVTKPIFGYRQFYGPMVSSPDSAARDAERLYGKPGLRVSHKPWHEASAYERKIAGEE